MSTMRTAFSDKALSVLTSEPFDGFRQSLRGVAKWLWLEGVSRKIARTDMSARFGKAAFQWLTTDSDLESEREADLKHYAERAVFRNSWAKSPEELREAIQSEIIPAGGVRYGISVDEVMDYIAAHMDDADFMAEEHGYKPDERDAMIDRMRGLFAGSSEFPQAQPDTLEA